MFGSLFLKHFKKTYLNTEAVTLFPWEEFRITLHGVGVTAGSKGLSISGLENIMELQSPVLIHRILANFSFHCIIFLLIMFSEHC